jgi:hypothetical protein
MTNIKQHNAPAFCRHLQTLSQLAGLDYSYPFDLFNTLVKLERKANRLTTALCNPIEDESQYEKIEKQLDKIENKVRELLPNAKTFFINRDPRGHALKIKEDERLSLSMWSDFGGYGILAPEF